MATRAAVSPAIEPAVPALGVEPVAPPAATPPQLAPGIATGLEPIAEAPAPPARAFEASADGLQVPAAVEEVVQPAQGAETAAPLASEPLQAMEIEGDAQAERDAADDASGVAVAARTAVGLPPPPVALVDLTRQAEDALRAEHERISMVELEPTSVVPEHAEPASVPPPERPDGTPLRWVREQAADTESARGRLRAALASALARGPRLGTLPQRAGALSAMLAESVSAARSLARTGGAKLRWAAVGGGAVLVIAVVLLLLPGSPTAGGAKALAAVEVAGSIMPPTEAQPDPAPPPAEVLVERPGDEGAVAEDDTDLEELEESQDDEAVQDPGATDEAEAARQARVHTAHRHVLRGHRLLRRGRLGLAEDAYLSALKDIPGYPRAMAGLVKVHLKRKAPVEALRWARKLARRQPRSALNQLLLGDAYQLMGAHSAARNAWRKASRFGSRTARKRLAK